MRRAPNFLILICNSRMESSSPPWYRPSHSFSRTCLSVHYSVTKLMFKKFKRKKSLLTFKRTAKPNQRLQPHLKVPSYCILAKILI